MSTGVPIEVEQKIGKCLIIAQTILHTNALAVSKPLATQGCYCERPWETLFAVGPTNSEFGFACTQREYLKKKKERKPEESHTDLCFAVAAQALQSIT